MEEITLSEILQCAGKPIDIHSLVQAYTEFNLQNTGHRCTKCPLNQFSCQPVWKCFYPCLILKSPSLFKLSSSGRNLGFFVEYRSVFPQQFLWPLASWLTASSVYATGRREGIAGRGCSSLKTVLSAVSSMVPEGFMWVAQEGSYFHLFQYRNNASAGCWKLYRRWWDVNAYFSMLCSVFSWLLYCVFDEVLIIIFCIFNATCQILWMQWRWSINKIISIMHEKNFVKIGPLHNE